ncbi:hypothetical protein FGO68_gene3858 [Halteria grandinella]|uniref:Uncharacterized protein n=1 Tax=Halteria grandinella TaxID=5974 RepID=A0A8J8NI14_HALGN|nr:hypothetical protein FGO68_gene3858 [Halteria grandinella]
MNQEIPQAQHQEKPQHGIIPSLNVSTFGAQDEATKDKQILLKSLAQQIKSNKADPLASLASSILAAPPPKQKQQDQDLISDDQQPGQLEARQEMMNERQFEFGDEAKLRDLVDQFDGRLGKSGGKQTASAAQKGSNGRQRDGNQQDIAQVSLNPYIKQLMYIKQIFKVDIDSRCKNSLFAPQWITLLSTSIRSITSCFHLGPLLSGSITLSYSLSSSSNFFSSIRECTQETASSIQVSQPQMLVAISLNCSKRDRM